MKNRHPQMTDAERVLPPSLIDSPTFGATRDMCLAWLVASSIARIPRGTRVELALLLAASERFNLAVGQLPAGTAIEPLLPLLEPLELGRDRMESAWRTLANGAHEGVVTTESLVVFHDAIRAIRVEHEQAWHAVLSLVGELDVTQHPFGPLPPISRSTTRSG